MKIDEKYANKLAIERINKWWEQYYINKKLRNEVI